MSQRLVHGEKDGKPMLIAASKNVGMRRAFKVLSFMAAWDAARSRLRKESITLDEYRAYWKESRTTAFRHQAHFREAFPGEDTPDRLLDIAAEQWDARTGVTGLGNVRIA